MEKQAKYQVQLKEHSYKAYLLYVAFLPDGMATGKQDMVYVKLELSV